MIKRPRRSKDPYSWSYHNDLIAATSQDLKYHVSLGIGEWFEKFLHQLYVFVPRPFSPIHFLSSAETESHQPVIGLMTESVGMLRMLEHPIAKEFKCFIPWTYRESFYVMRRLMSQMESSLSMPEMYKNIEDVRWINHKLSRRTMLEEIIGQLTAISLNQFWEAIPCDKTIEQWINVVSQKIKRLRLGELHYFKINLPCNENYRVPAIIFWLQLLETVLAYQFPYWKVYWNEHSMLFFNAPHTAIDVVKLFELESELGVKEEGAMVPNDMNIPLIRLLTCWGDVLRPHPACGHPLLK